MARDILIVDDEADIRLLISGILGDEGFQTREAGESDAALAQLRSRRPNLIILDIWLNNSTLDGMGLLEVLKVEFPEVPVIMISGHGNIETAVTAIKNGAYDFIEKPLSHDKTLLAINKGLHVAHLERENRILRDTTATRPNLTGTSPLIRQLREQIERVAPTSASVLIRGGHGTGKELVAQTIHSRSSRRGKPFIKVNCAAIPRGLLESELFGFEKGAFTGAHLRKPGKFELASGGSILLNEIGDIDISLQAKLLQGGGLGVAPDLLAGRGQPIQKAFQAGRVGSLKIQRAREE